MDKKPIPKILKVEIPIGELANQAEPRKSGTLYGDSGTYAQWRINWTSEYNSSTRNSSVTAKFYIYVQKTGSQSWNNYDHTSWVQIGSSKNTKTTTRFDLRGKPVGYIANLCEHTTTISHNWGNNSVTISASHPTGVSLGTKGCSGSATLDSTAPPVPTNVTLGGGCFAAGSQHKISWTAVSGVNYQVFMSKRDQNGNWSGWQHHQDMGNANSCTISYGYNSNNYRDVQVGVRATAGGLNTEVVGTGPQMRRGSRVLLSNGWTYPVIKARYSDGNWGNVYVRILLSNGTWLFA